MSNSYFKFKQFTVNQSSCSMKVGTDGVLLGAWADVGDKESCCVLDIGAGTGVISLIAAQRNSEAIIDSVELDVNSAKQCSENFKQSPWADRLSVCSESIQDFANKSTIRYDYILSNPPYFNNSVKSDDFSRNLARHTDSLSYEELARCVSLLLGENGVFSAIFPYAESSVFVAIAASYGLYCNRRLEIKGNPTSPVKRVLLQFTFSKGDDIEIDSMSIELYERHDYSPKYKELTKPYYLMF